MSSLPHPSLVAARVAHFLRSHAGKRTSRSVVSRRRSRRRGGHFTQTRSRFFFFIETRVVVVVVVHITPSVRRICCCPRWCLFSVTIKIIIVMTKIFLTSEILQRRRRLFFVNRTGVVDIPTASRFYRLRWTWVWRRVWTRVWS